MSCKKHKCERCIREEIKELEDKIAELKKELPAETGYTFPILPLTTTRCCPCYGSGTLGSGTCLCVCHRDLVTCSNTN